MISFPSSRRSCLCSGRCLWWRWVELMILRWRLKIVVSGPTLCPAQCSSKIQTRDDRRRWPSSGCLSLLDPWSRVVHLHQPVHDLFFRRPQPVVRTQTSRPSAGLQSSCGTLRCELVVVPVLRYRHRGQSSLRHHRSKSALRRLVLATLFSFSTSLGEPFRPECRMHCHCHPGTTEQLAFRVPSSRK